MTITQYFIKFICFFLVFYLTSCSVFKKTPKDSDDTNVTQQLQAQLVPNALAIDQIAPLKLELINTTTDSINFNPHTRIIVNFTLGKSAIAVEDTSFWNSNRSATTSSGWIYTSFVNGQSEITNGGQPLTLPPQGIVFINYKAVKPITTGIADINLKIVNSTIGITPKVVQLKKTQGEISMTFTASSKTIITDTDRVKFNWDVKNASVITLNNNNVPSNSDTTLSFSSRSPGKYPYVLNASANGKSKQETINVYLKRENDSEKVNIQSPATLWSSEEAIFKINDKTDKVEYSKDGLTYWSTKPDSVPIQMKTSPAIFFKGNSYLIGGSRIQPDILSNEIYEFSNGNWTKLGHAKWSKRMGHATIVFNNKLYVIGGFNEYGNPLKEVWSWAGGTSDWIPEPDLPTARGVSIAGVRGDSIWIGGGFNSFSGKPLNSFLAFDGSKWDILQFNSPPIDLCAGSFQSAEGRFYIINTAYSDQSPIVSNASEPVSTRSGASYIGKIIEISKDLNNGKWTTTFRANYQGVIPSQFFDINTTFFNGAIWIRSLDYNKEGPGFYYFIP